MGVYHAHIILYGCRCSYDKIPNEDEIGYEEYQEKVISREWDEQNIGDIAFVIDGMGGDYFFVGVLQYKTEKSRSGQPTIEPHMLEKPDEEQMFELASVMKDFGLDTSMERGHYVLTHHF